LKEHLLQFVLRAAAVSCEALPASSFGSAHSCIMRAASSIAAFVLLACVLSFSAPVDAAQPAEFQTLLDNIQALKVSSSTPHAPLCQP
jgi:hypothetical protein